MKTGIATVSISGNLDDKIDAIAAAGFSGIEIFEQDFLTDIRSPAEVGRRVRDAGLEILLFQPFRDFEGLPGDLRARAFDRFERKFDLMQDLGTDLVLVCSSVHPQALGGIDRAAADFAELGERAARRGMRVGYEALAWGRHVNDHRDAWEVVRRADHPNVGLILDSFHTLSRKIDPETIRRIPGDKIFFVQLADAPLIEMDLLYWSRHFRNMPGEGDLDVTAFLRAVMATGYAGPVSLEIFNDQFRSGDTRLIARDGFRSVRALMDDVQRAEPDLRCDYPLLAPRARVEGVSFVEFASRDEEAEALAVSLGALGFARVGTHRNKAVSLWKQGDAHIVVNEERSGYAASAWNVRGTTVCDIGLRVDDAQAAAERARALGADSFEQAKAAGELDIPMVRGLAGSLIHFLDASLDPVWEVEFTLEPGDAKGVGLRRIDHIAQTMTYADMLSWSLFYTALLDMRALPMVDVIDPDGLVRSQAVTSPDGGLRLTLNGAEGHRTLAGKFLRDTFGAPVQHLAFATDDLIATADRLQARGFTALPLPGNYYDDLDARFALGAERIAALKARNILYDADATGGSFLQLFARDKAGQVFFEIVERRGGYDGFGAANAPFRIAAQKRLERPKGLPTR